MSSDRENVTMCGLCGGSGVRTRKKYINNGKNKILTNEVCAMCHGTGIVFLGQIDNSLSGGSNTSNQYYNSTLK